MAIPSAEASKPKKGPKSLDHLEIHPKLGGGHIVRHVYSGYEHEPKEVKFNKDGKSQGGEHIQTHLDKHAGLPAYEHEAESGSNHEIEGESE